MKNWELWTAWIIGPVVGWLRSLPRELSASLATEAVWAAMAAAVVVGAISFVVGYWAADRVGLLPDDAQHGEILGVGLGVGLTVSAVAIAAAGSAGNSAFTPVAIGFGLALLIASAGPRRAGTGERWRRVRSNLLNRRFGYAALGGVLFVLTVGLAFGTTLAPSPRDGVQPVEFMDEAYYPVLATGLVANGTESIMSPAGIEQPAASGQQHWYHWGEIWLTAGAIRLLRLEPILAHFYLVLPLLLLAATTLTGTLVRRTTRSRGLAPFLVGAACCLILAPIPLRLYPFFGWWARGLLFGISLYGLAAVIVLLILYSILSRRHDGGWPYSIFSGSLVACLLPAHIVIAALGLAGISCVTAVRLVRSSFVERRRLDLPNAVIQTTAVAVSVATATFAWGVATDHGLGASGSSVNVAAFNESWFASLGLNVIGGGALFSIPVAWLLTRRERGFVPSLMLGVSGAVVIGAFVWGARLSDFNAFHVFFGALAVYAPVAAAIAIWTLWVRLRRIGYQRTSTIFMALFIGQLVIGGISLVERLVAFGPGVYEPVPLEMLGTIRQLPPTAKIAYACQPFEEVALWDPRLISIQAHTGKPIVPMCFQTETFSVMTGGPILPESPSPFFALAPQRELYPTALATPTAAEVTSFLKRNGIAYVYADAAHPQLPVVGAVPVATFGQAQLSRLP